MTNSKKGRAGNAGDRGVGNFPSVSSGFSRSAPSSWNQKLERAKKLGWLPNHEKDLAEKIAHLWLKVRDFGYSIPIVEDALKEIRKLDPLEAEERKA